MLYFSIQNAPGGREKYPEYALLKRFNRFIGLKRIC